MSIRSNKLGTFAIAWTAALMTACSSSLSLDAAASGEARILMHRDTSESSAAPSDSAPAGSRAVEDDTVESFRVTVIAIEFLQAGAGDTSATSPAWTSVDVGSNFTIDLMALPTSGAAASLIADGSVRAGSYSAVRLRVTNPRITFKGDLSFGVGGILQGGTEYEVIIPSQTQAGLRASASVTIEANTNSDVSLVFDCARSLGNVAVSGTGQVLMSAVLRAE